MIKFKNYAENQLGFFPAYVTTIEINRIQESISRPLGYEFHQLFLVSDGKGIIEIDKKTYNLDKNDLFFISKDIPHSYYGTNSEFKTSFISFFSDEFDKIKKYYAICDYGIYKNKNTGNFESKISHLFDDFESTYEISSLCAMTYNSIIAFFDETCKKEYSTIETVFNYIKNNYSKPVTLDDILKFYPYSKSKLCREFKEKYSVSIFDMLTETRLKNAYYMIKTNPHLKLKEIASSCGFNDISYFCKMYREKYKKSPKEK